MSILVWIKPDGGFHYGYPLPHGLADVICGRRRAHRFFPGGYRLAYRLRVKERRQ